MKRLISIALVLLTVISLMSVAFATTSLSSAPYANVEYSYTTSTPCGTIRYISQLTSSGYFNWNYWPTSSFGGYASPGSECGTASISMALSYIGINKTPKDILNAHNGYTYFGDNWGGATSSSPSLSTAISNFVNGIGKYSPPIIHLPSYSAAGHYVIIAGKISSSQYSIVNPAADSVGTMTISGTSWSYNGKSGSIDQVYQYYNKNASITPVNQDPGKPAFNSLKNKYPQNSTIVFAWDATENTTHYNFYLYKRNSAGNWNVDEHSFEVQSGFTRCLGEGSYRALLQAYNSNAWKDDYSDWRYTESDYFYFTVAGDHVCNFDGAYKWTWSAHPHYKCYECSICGEIHENRNEPTMTSACEICLANHEHDRGEYLWQWTAHPHYKCYRCSFCGQEWADYSQPVFWDSCLECHRPEKPSFTGMQETYKDNYPVQFFWEDTLNTTHYNIWLYKEGVSGNWETAMHQNYVESGISFTLSVGSYRVLLQSYNKNYWEDDHSDWLCRESDYFYFSVINQCPESHSYTYKVTTTPTTSASGVLTGTCSRCSATTTVTLPKLNTTDYTYAVTKAATCTAAGIGRYTWKTTTYGSFYFDVTIAKTAHTYKDTVTAPTCTEKGYTTYTCACGDSYITDYVGALGHNFVGGVCTRCGADDPNYDPPVHNDPCEGYTDINRSGWYHSAADFVIERGLMGSTKADTLTFEPNTKVSRAMVASILYTMAGKPDVIFKGTFTDVKYGMWFTNAIEWCAQNGLASGKGDGKFDPNGNVTRQELAVFMMQMAAYLGKDTSGRADLGGFADAAKVPSWAKTYVQWAVDAGLISGKASGGKTYLAPADNASRAELAAIIRSFVQNIAE